MSILNGGNTELYQKYVASRKAGNSPVSTTFEGMTSAVTALVDGREVVTIGTHNYLGLANNQECIDAAIEALKIDGTGTCGSRMANGSFSGHLALEKELAKLHNFDHCIIYTTGYQTNLGTISGLVGEGDFLVLDMDSHASIFDAAKATQASTVLFRHNDPDSLDKRLTRLGKEPGAKLVVVEGVYSMMGDVAPLREFSAICKKHGAYLLVDEAHSMGSYGVRGSGLCEQLDLLEDIDFICGTFSKSLGAVGGYCVSNNSMLDQLRTTARPYMFTASLPPATIASVRQALKLIEHGTNLRKDIWRNINALHSTLTKAGIKVAAEPSPIVSVVMPSVEALYFLWNQLFEKGYYVNVGLPPATPNNYNLLRCAISAAHTEEQMIGMAEATIEIIASMNIK